MRAKFAADRFCLRSEQLNACCNLDCDPGLGTAVNFLQISPLIDHGVGCCVLNSELSWLTIRK